MPEEKSLAQKIAPISDWLNQGRVISAVRKVLPRHLTPERFIQIAITTVQRNPYLLECSPLSVVGCVIEASVLGLSLEPLLGQAYLVPFKNKNTNKREAQLIPGYRGLVHLARNSGVVRTVSAEVVRKGDQIEVRYGTDRSIRHVPNFEAKDRHKEESWVGAYAVAPYVAGGDPDFVYLERDRVLDARSRSMSFKQNNGPWITDPEEMWRKTPIRRLAKLLPQSTDLMRSFAMATELEERRSLGLPGANDSLIDLGDLAEIPAPAALPESNPEPEEKEEHKQGPRRASESKATASPAASAVPAIPTNPEGPSPDEIKTVQETAMQAGFALSELKLYLKKWYGTEHIKDLKKAQIPALITELKNGGRKD